MKRLPILVSLFLFFLSIVFAHFVTFTYASTLFQDSYTGSENTSLTTHDPFYSPVQNNNAVIVGNKLVGHASPYYYNGIQPVQDQSISYDVLSDLSAPRAYEQWERYIPNVNTLETKLVIQTDGSGELDFWNGSGWVTLVTYPTGNFQDATIYNFNSVVKDQSLTIYLNGVSQYSNSSIVPSNITQGTFGFNLYNANNYNDQTTNVTIDNLKFSEMPIGVGIISTTPNPVQQNNAISTSGTFNDADATDNHTATWNWGDGKTTTCPSNTSQCTVTESNGSGSVSGSHTYTTSGSYTVTLTVTNNANGSSSISHQVVTVSNTSLLIDSYTDSDNTLLTTHDTNYVPFNCGGDYIVSNQLNVIGGCPYFYNGFTNTQDQSLSYDIISNLSKDIAYQQWTRVTRISGNSTSLQTKLLMNTDGSGELDFWNNSNWTTLATYPTNYFQNATTYNLQTDVIGQSLAVYLNGVTQYYNTSIIPSSITQGGFAYNVYNNNNYTDTSTIGVIDNLVYTPNPTLQPITLTTDQDSFIQHNGQNQNEGASPFLELSIEGKDRALVHFNESQIQAAVGSNPNYTATLQLTIVSNNNKWSTGRQIDVNRMEQSWTEGNGSYDYNGNRGTGSGVTWDCASDNDTANTATNCSGLTAWDMIDQASWPFYTIPSALATITNNESGTISFDVTSDVQSFLTGNNPNDGWIIKKDDENQDGDIQFGSKESSYSPKLIITPQ